MDRIGLLREIYDSVANIDQGRVWLDTVGFEANGRASYRRGLEVAMSSFQSAQANAATDLELVILAEQTFITQELQFCDSSDTQAIASLEQAIKSFDDALRSLEVVSDPVLYSGAEKTYPTGSNHRYKKMPKDAFHIACIAHRTRIGNILRAPGINIAEKQLLTRYGRIGNTRMLGFHLFAVIPEYRHTQILTYPEHALKRRYPG